MTDLTRLPPVFGEGIDPRLLAIMETAPAFLRVIFAGPDQEFREALHSIYGVALRAPDVIVLRCGRGLIVSVAPADESDDGLILNMTLAPDGSFFVTPVLLFTEARKKGARERLRPKHGHPDLLVHAVENLIFRRVMPAEKVS